MAIHGASNQGGRSVTVRMNAKTPQKKTSTPIDTTIFCAAASPTTFATRSSVTSNKILFHCFAMYSPGASPLAINCASQALYTWLARSPASIRRCHTHGTTSVPDRNSTGSLNLRSSGIRPVAVVLFADMLIRKSGICSVKVARAILLLKRLGSTTDSVILSVFPEAEGEIVQTRTHYVLRAHRNQIGAPRWLLQTTLLLAISLKIADLTRAQEHAPAANCPPTARIDSVKDTYGSTVVPDPYRWLEDQNSPETRGWIDAEQKCTEAALSNLPGRVQLTKRLGELLHTDSFETPVERGGRYFFRKRLAGQDLMQLYIRRSLNAPDELLIDP